VTELIDDINANLADRNANPKPCKWTASAAREKSTPHELHKGN
jgi:hypothetical protein